ncbi:MAG TPA: Ig-like domain-containing protein [Acidobacteriaceae bacterium]|nr:Ig-like domain-containing protein [Acidobacteriaceae bacterium]
MQGSRSFCSRHVVFLLFFSLPIALLTACSGGGSGSTTTPPPSTPTLSSISVTPGTPSVAAGLTQQFKATGTWSDGSTKDITSTATWTSGTTTVATINAAGLATSKAQGTAVITAASGSVSGSATLTVSPAVLVSISVAPASVQIGATTQMKATGTWTDQSTQDLTSTVTWSLANSYVASISASGLVTSLRAGYSTVTATDGSLQGSGSVAVVAYPRYLYVSGDSGGSLTRMAVDGETGQPRFLGYVTNPVGYNVVSPCITVDPSGTHLYVASSGQNPSTSTPQGSIAVFSIDPATGIETPVSGSPFSYAFPVGCLVFAPSGNVAYATSGFENAGNQLATFTVNTNASLTLNSTMAFPYYPTGVVVDPLGKYAYVDVVDVLGGTSATSELYGYSIDATTGSLTQLDGSPWSLPAGTYGELSFHPSGETLYVGNLSGAAVGEYTINRGTGVPTQSGTSNAPCSLTVGPQFSPDATHAYGICGAGGPSSSPNNTVLNFTVAANGQLTLQNTAYGGPVPRQIQVDPSGKFVYVVGVGTDAATTSNSNQVAFNVVMLYEAQADGSLKLVNQIAGRVAENSLALVSGPTPVTWKTTSAYITTAGDNKLTPYTVASDGTLTAGTGITTAAGPFSASMLPWSSNLLFATKSAAPNLYSYSVSGTTLSNGLSFGSAATTGGIVISPDMSPSPILTPVAYSTDTSAGAVDKFVDISTSWWETGNPAFTAGAGAGPIAMDPAGRYLAAANQTAKSISLFDPSGAAPPPATALAFTPLTLAVDATGNLFFAAGDDSKLHMFSSNGLGTLTDVADGTLLGNNTASVAIDPTGRFVYTGGPAGLNAFSVDVNAGTLTPVALNLGVSLQNTTCVSIDPSGKNLYVAVSNGTINALYLFTINSDGTLTASGANPIAAPNLATSIVFQATVQ